MVFCGKEVNGGWKSSARYSNFIFSLFLGLLLEIGSVHASVNVPAGVVNYLPITLTNNQNSAVTAGTPLAIGASASGSIIGFNAIAYQQYETCNLGNAEFFFSNGTVIKSWLEGNLINELTANPVCTSSSSCSS